MGVVLYDDGGISLDEDGLTIRRYYFPWAGPKRISYTNIRRVVARPMGWLPCLTAARPVSGMLNAGS
jgi:hypothetical protein